MQKEKKLYEEANKRQSNFNEVLILKKENEFLKLEQQKYKKEVEQFKSLVEFEKFKNEKMFYELMK